MSDIHLDDAVLAALQDVMEAEYPALLDTFVADSEERVRLLREAEAQGDPQGLRLAAHSFKGSCINIGAPRLGGLCFEAEQLGKDATLEQAPAVLERIEAEFSEVARRLQNFGQEA